LSVNTLLLEGSEAYVPKPMCNVFPVGVSVIPLFTVAHASPQLCPPFESEPPDAIT
jgi:hypothetical protein